MRTVLINVYGIDELDKKSQRKAIERVQVFYLLDHVWTEDMSMTKKEFEAYQWDEDSALSYARDIGLEFFKDGSEFDDELYEAMV